MRGWTLGSGSSGNALLLESGPYRLLLDCGFGPRAIATRLRRLGVAPESIGGLLVTHEHEDHAMGAERAQKKYRWPVIATAGTLRALPEVEPRWRHPVSPGTVFATDGFLVEAVEVPHDAAEPCAFVVTATESGARVGIAHDLGAVHDSLPIAFARCDALCLEANHDVEMLRTGPYPPSLQSRVRGGRGHLSNAGCGALADAVAHPGLRGVVLLHLSAVNNTPELAGRTVASALRVGGHRAKVRVAPRHEVAVAFDLEGSRRVGQLTLSL